VISIKDFQGIDVNFNCTTILEKTVKESLSTKRYPIESEILQLGYVIYQWTEEMVSLPLRSQNKNCHACGHI
jgi:hypothetical protein